MWGHCNSVKTAQPGDRTTEPDIVMAERYESSQRVGQSSNHSSPPYTHPATPAANIKHLYNI